MTEKRTRPKVSIGLPVYNGARYLRATIDSILGQTFTDLELIICDNASTDATRDICLEYLDRDRRIRYIRNPHNLGASINYNTVFARSTGVYFKWASCNDTIDPDFLARCVTVLDRDPSVVLVYPRTCLVDFNGQPMEHYEDRLNLMDDSPYERYRRLMHNIRLNNAMNGLIRADQLARTALHGIFIGSDITFIAELSLYGKFCELPEYLFFRRMTPEAVYRNGHTKELLNHFYPRRIAKRVFPYWRRNWEHFAAVRRSPIRLVEKLKLTVFLAKWVYWEKRRLLAELQGTHWGEISPAGQSARRGYA